MEKTTRPVVIITGASRGLGRAMALKFGRSGFRVAVNYLQQTEAVRETVQEILQSGGEAAPFQADIRNFQEVERLVSEVHRSWGTADVLIHNAGITVDSLLPATRDDDWNRVLDTHLKGAFNLLRTHVRAMMDRGHGHIIHIGSRVGLIGRAGQSAYAAAKAGLVGLTLSAARELGPSGVQVNLVLPGFLPTGIQESLSDRAREEILRAHFLSSPPEINEVVDFIYALSRMKGVSGQVFNLDSRPVITL